MSVTDNGMHAVTYITVMLVCIFIAWWALQAFRFDIFVREPKRMKAKVLQLLFAVVLGYQLAKFLLDYAYYTSLLKWLA